MRLLLLLLAAAGAAPGLSFVVLGDRTGEARDTDFRRILDEVRLLSPDLIVGTGDLIEGYTDSVAVLNAQWDSVLGMLGAAGVPAFFAPGNHDISGPAAESIFTGRVNRTTWSLARGNVFFVFADNSRWREFTDWPQAQRRRFRVELGKAQDYQHCLVLMHRPWWRYALERGTYDTLLGWCRDAGVDYLLSGHDHFYCSANLDGITCIQVGPSGSRLKVYDDPAQGAFQNYLIGRVAGPSLSFTVVRPGALEPVDVVTFETVREIDRGRTQAVTLEPFPVAAGSSRSRLVFRDLAGQEQSGRMKWSSTNPAWQVEPGSLNFRCEPGGGCDYDLVVRLADAAQPWPLPVLTLPYRYADDRTVELSVRLPVKRRAKATRIGPKFRLDGRLVDRDWQRALPVAGFADREFMPDRVEPVVVRFGFDSLNLYLAVSCVESRPDSVRARVQERDGPVYEDDHVNVVIAPLPDDTAAYYQVFVNPAGTVADRRCRLVGGRSERDWSWNADWTVAPGRTDERSWSVELSCPLAAFGPTTAGEWRINCTRTQTRLGATAAWQPPFTHDPSTFGILER